MFLHRARFPPQEILVGLERQSGRRACLEIDGGKQRDPANTNDTRGKDPMAMLGGEGILTSERIVHI